MDYLVQIHIGIITFYDFSCRLQCTDNLLDTFQFVTFHFRSLIQQYNIAKFNLLDNQIFNILFINPFTGQVIAARKLTLQTQGIYHSHNAIQVTSSMHSTHTRNRTNGLCDGSRFTNATRLNHDVIKTVQLHDIIYLLHQIHFQGATDATILKCHQAFIFLPYNSLFLYKIGVNVHLTDIIDNNRKLNPTFIRKNMVHQCRFSTAQITGQKQYRNFFYFHIKFNINETKV